MSEHEVSDWFAGRSRVLFVHAHPDDETITTGGTLAALAAAGREPILVTLTRGERGEVTPGSLQALVHEHGLAVVRQNELATALEILGVTRHAFLGVPPARAEGLAPTIYEDSGMAWGDDGRAIPAADVSAAALTRVPAVDLLNDLLAASYLAGAQALVSYDDGGGYGHPDHVLAHRLARAVAHALEVPFWEIVSPSTAAMVAEKAEYEPNLHAIDEWFDQKLAALGAYQTQLAVAGEDIVHVGGQREAVSRREVFRMRP